MCELPLPAKAANPSSVMVKLDATIRGRGCRADPRVKPEDDVGEWGEVRQQTAPLIPAFRPAAPR
ncbi:hypothetical protein GCM10007923_10710 [Shinella yambaruensis]|uniref:Uncharacterized protein n=1 Tax=Shinella yambaruensis TaxID=415996 RepID=A0ABQ5ZCV5_9HYPH|nr:hypothetical protein GCM10007923_10710 [Shinella yambaruensis]